MLILAVVVFGAVVSLGLNRGPGSVVADTDLAPGMCLASLSYVSGVNLPLSDCAEGHAAEVVATHDFQVASYPGEDQLADAAASTCVHYAEAASEMFQIRGVQEISFYPTEQTWQAGDRTITCLIAAPAGLQFYGSYTEMDLQAR